MSHAALPKLWMPRLNVSISGLVSLAWEVREREREVFPLLLIGYFVYRFPLTLGCVI